MNNFHVQSCEPTDPHTGRDAARCTPTPRPDLLSPNDGLERYRAMAATYGISHHETTDEFLAVVKARREIKK